MKRLERAQRFFHSDITLLINADECSVSSSSHFNVSTKWLGCWLGSRANLDVLVAWNQKCSVTKYGINGYPM